MNERVTVRLLVFNSRRELLLMHIDDSSISDGKVDKTKGFWITLGGRVEPGETLEAAALREALEETGQNISLGPKVWYGEQILKVKSVPTLLKETFFVASLEDIPLSRSGWTAEEKTAVKELRWWNVLDLAATPDVVFPECMKQLVIPISEGRYPDEVLPINL